MFFPCIFCLCYFLIVSFFAVCDAGLISCTYLVPLILLSNMVILISIQDLEFVTFVKHCFGMTFVDTNKQTSKTNIKNLASKLA